MRIRFKPTPEQRSALRAQLTRVQQPATALRILRPTLPAEFTPARAVCTVQSVHSDRFVVRVELCSNAGEERAYALKAYSDDFGEKVWAHARALAEHYPPNHNGLCLPNHYVPRERLMVFPWVDGGSGRRCRGQDQRGEPQPSAGMRRAHERSPIPAATGPSPGRRTARDLPQWRHGSLSADR